MEEFAEDEFVAGELTSDGLAASVLAAGEFIAGGLDAGVFDMNEFVRTFLTVLTLTRQGSFRLFNALPQLMLSRLSQTLL